MKDEIITVRPTVTTVTVQQLPNYVGISELTAGSTGLSMNLVVIPAGAKADPHFHQGYETAIYLLKGRVETRYGENLAKTVVNEAGDFILSRLGFLINPSISARLRPHWPSWRATMPTNKSMFNGINPSPRKFRWACVTGSEVAGYWSPPGKKGSWRISQGSASASRARLAGVFPFEGFIRYPNDLFFSGGCPSVGSPLSWPSFRQSLDGI